MTKKQQNKLVPKLRFPEFKSNFNWESKTLHEILREHGLRSTGEEKVYSVSVHKGIVNQIEHLGRSFSASNTDNYKLVLPGDLVYTKSPTGDFPYGIIKQSKQVTAVIVSPLYGVFTPITSELGYILDAYFETPSNAYNYLSSIVQKGAKNTININNETFLSKQLTIPTDYKEQQKIADCLSSLDDLIAAENEKLKALQEHKKGMMQQLFPAASETVPKLRFKEFEGSGEWQVEQLIEVYEFKPTNSFSRDNLNYESGEVKNIHYGDIHTKYPTLLDLTTVKIPYINASSSIRRIPNEYYCREGDILFADASEDLNDIGKNIEVVNLNNELLLSGLHTLLARQRADKLIVGFGGYLFNAPFIRKQIQREAQGSKVLGISATRISSIRLVFPSNKIEQQRIKNAFIALDEQINKQAEKIETFKLHKKGLMQQLFPKVNGESFSEVLEATMPTVKKKQKKQLKLSDEDKRDLLGGYIISKADLSKDFGHIKFVKHLVTAEYYGEFSMPTAYHQHNNGPYDKKFMEGWAFRLKQKEWFEEVKTKKGYTYKPLAKAGEIESLFSEVFSEKKEAVDFVIRLMNSSNPNQAEIIATIYAVWNDLIQYETDIDESVIEAYFFKWSDSKAKSFTPEQVRSCYRWMNEKKFIPKGNGTLIMNLC